MRDVFQPTIEPARSIYVAFQEEAKNRSGRSIEEWMTAELDAVYREAVFQAQALGMRVPSREEVVSAERYAMGSADYGAKWAYKVVDAMRKSESSKA
jgi:hypothetical protein